LDEDDAKFSLSLIQNEESDGLQVGERLSKDENIGGACCKLKDSVDIALDIVCFYEVQKQGCNIGGINYL